MEPCSWSLSVLAPGPGYRAQLLPLDLYCLQLAGVTEVHLHGSAVDSDRGNKARLRMSRTVRMEKKKKKILISMLTHIKVQWQ